MSLSSPEVVGPSSAASSMWCPATPPSTGPPSRSRWPAGVAGIGDVPDVVAAPPSSAALAPGGERDGCWRV